MAYLTMKVTESHRNSIKILNNDVELVCSEERIIQFGCHAEILAHIHCHFVLINSKVERKKKIIFKK